MAQFYSFLTFRRSIPLSSVLKLPTTTVFISMLFINTTGCFAEGNSTKTKASFAVACSTISTVNENRCTSGTPLTTPSKIKGNRKIRYTLDTLPCGTVSMTAWAPYDAFLTLLDSTLTSYQFSNKFFEKPTRQTNLLTYKDIWLKYDGTTIEKTFRLYPFN